MHIYSVRVMRTKRSGQTYFIIDTNCFDIRLYQRYCPARIRGAAPLGSGVLPRSDQRYCLARIRGAASLGSEVPLRAYVKVYQVECRVVEKI